MRLSGIGSHNHTGLNDRRTKDNVKQALIVEFGIDANGISWIKINNQLLQHLCLHCAKKFVTEFYFAKVYP